MNNNSAVQASLTPEYTGVIFHGISHFSSARCVLHVPYSILSRPLFIYFHLPLCFYYYYPYYSLSSLFYTSPTSPVLSSSCACRYHHMKPSYKREPAQLRTGRTRKSICDLSPSRLDDTLVSDSPTESSPLLENVL